MSTSDPIIVIGGGVIGLCAAHDLRRRGADVVVVEQGSVGCGASYGNAGWVVPSMSAPLAAPGVLRIAAAAMARKHGPLRLPPSSLPAMLPWLLRFWTHCSAAEHTEALLATGRLAADAAQLYDELAEDGVAFEMSADGLLSVFSDHDAAQRSAAALQPLSTFGYDSPELLDAGQLRVLEPALGHAAAAGYLIGQERVVEPASLSAGLTTRLREMGVPVLEHWSVRRLEQRSSRIHAVTGPAGELAASAVVIAAGARSTGLLGQLGVRLHMQPGKGYSMSVRAEGLPRRAVLLSEAKIAVTPFRDRTRIAGLMEFAGYDDRPHRRRLASLAAAARPFLNPWTDADESDAWCGWRPVTPDGLPVIGRLPTVRNAVVATGHAMLGVTLAPATGRAVADLMLEDEAPPSLHPFRLERPGLARWRSRSPWAAAVETRTRT